MIFFPVSKEVKTFAELNGFTIALSMLLNVIFLKGNCLSSGKSASLWSDE